MIDEKLTTEKFERDSLGVFEKLLQGYQKAQKSIAWESNMDSLIDKMTHLPTAPFPSELMKMFDYNYLILSEDISTIIQKALVIRRSMEHKRRYVRIEKRYYTCPCLPKETYLKWIKVFNHEGDLCYHENRKIDIKWNRLLNCFFTRTNKTFFQNVFTFEQKVLVQKNLEIYHYSPFVDLTQKDPISYYNFFCDYYGKTQFLKYFSTKDTVVSNSLDTSYINKASTLEEVRKLTSSQQVLWAYFIFRLLGLNLRINLEVAIMTRFLLMINKTSFVEYKKSYFYKLVSKAPYVKDDKKLLPDLEIIKLHFKNENLPTNDIENEIEKLITNL